jgi:hypothetical protein
VLDHNIRRLVQPRRGRSTRDLAALRDTSLSGKGCYFRRRPLLRRQRVRGAPCAPRTAYVRLSGEDLLAESQPRFVGLVDARGEDDLTA